MKARVRFGSVSIDCRDPVKLAGFWAELTGGDIDPQGEGLAVVRGDAFPSLVFLQVAQDKTVKNRVHIDLEADDIPAAVERAQILGARRPEGDLAGPFPWTVLLDPEGNEFCICPPESDSP